MRTPPLPADFTHTRVCKPFCEKFLTLPILAAGISRGGGRAFFDKLGGRIETEKDTANFLLDVAVSFSEIKKNGSF